MKFIYFFLLLISFVSCKKAKTENNDTIIEVTSNRKKNILKEQKNYSCNIQIVKTIFSGTKVINEKATDSLLLLDIYRCSVSKESNPIKLNFPKCIFFSNQKDFNNEFSLKETNVWYEEALEHTNLFYLDHKYEYVIVVDLLKTGTLKECDVSKGNDFILDAIRIFKKDVYAEKSRTSNSPFYMRL